MINFKLKIKFKFICTKNKQSLGRAIKKYKKLIFNCFQISYNRNNNIYNNNNNIDCFVIIE